MQEKTIVKIAYILILFGFAFLIIYSNEIDLEKVQDIDSIQNNEEVRIKGVVDSVTTKDKAVFLTITGQKTETLNIILFGDKEVHLKAGDEVEISGKVEEYNGKKEIIASEVFLR